MSLVRGLTTTSKALALRQPIAHTSTIFRSLSSQRRAIGFFDKQQLACSSLTRLTMVRRNYRGSTGNNINNNNSDRNRRPRRARSPPPPMPPPGSPGRGCFKELIKPGLEVYVVKKDDQRNGKETRGVVDRLLTNSQYHPRGIKVMLESGAQVGRVTRIVNDV